CSGNAPGAPPPRGRPAECEAPPPGLESSPASGDHDLLRLVLAFAAAFVAPAGATRREGGRRSTRGRTPGDRQLELALGLPCNLDPPAPSAFTEPRDAAG